MKALVFGGGFVGLIWALYSALCVAVVTPQYVAPVVIEAARPVPPQPTVPIPAPYYTGLGTVFLADVLVIPEGAVETGGETGHAVDRHGLKEVEEVRAAGQAAILAEPMLGKQPPCKNDGRTRLIFPMQGGWGVWVLEQVGDQLYREITAFKTTNREYVRRVRDDCGNGDWFGHAYAQ